MYVHEDWEDDLSAASVENAHVANYHTLWQRNRYKEILRAKAESVEAKRKAQQEASANSAAARVRAELRRRETKRELETRALLSAARESRAAAAAAAEAEREAKRVREEEAREEARREALAKVEGEVAMMAMMMAAPHPSGGGSEKEEDDNEEEDDEEEGISWLERRRLEHARREGEERARAAREKAAREAKREAHMRALAARERIRQARAAAEAACVAVDAVTASDEGRDSFGALMASDPVVAAFHGYALGPAGRKDGAGVDSLVSLALMAMLTTTDLDVRQKISSLSLGLRLQMLRLILDRDVYVDMGLRVQLQSDSELLVAFQSFVRHLGEKYHEALAGFQRRWPCPPPIQGEAREGSGEDGGRGASDGVTGRWPHKPVSEYITDADMLEIHGYPNPPVFVTHVCQAICVLLGRPRGDASKVQHSMDALHSLQELEPSTLDIDTIRKLYVLVGSNAFTPSLGAEVSKPVARVVALLCDIFSYMVAFLESGEEGVRVHRLRQERAMWERRSEAMAVYRTQLVDAENLLAVLLTRQDGGVVEGELDLDLGPEFELAFGQSWLDMDSMEPTTSEASWSAT